jgi:phosphatidylglycerol:prolipoprotein diacylglycerol transferase
VGLIIFSILWFYRKKFKIDGKLFFLYLILSGIARLLVEFIRLNTKIIFGLSEAQLISIILITIGIYFYFFNPFPQTVNITEKSKSGAKKK